MTLEMPIGIGALAPDSGVYWSKLASELSMTNAKQQFCWVFPAPTGSDLGGELAFKVPAGYSSTPALVIRGIIDGTPANTFAVSVQLLQRDVSEGVDTAYEAEDTASNATWTGYADEDEYEIGVTLTPTSAFVPGRMVYLTVRRDDSVDDTTWAFLVTYFGFSYTEA